MKTRLATGMHISKVRTCLISSSELVLFDGVLNSPYQTLHELVAGCLMMLVVEEPLMNKPLLSFIIVGYKHPWEVVG